MTAKINPKIIILLNWELDNINSYLQEGLEYYSDKIEQADDKQEFPKLSQKGLAVGSFRYFRRSVLCELNSLVEEYLLFFSTDLAEEIAFFQNSNLKKSRGKSINIISSKYDLDLSLLPGYHDVEEMKEIVNGLKHRGGFDFTDFSKQIPIIKTVNDDADSLSRMMQSVDQFLKALVQKVLETK
jgi:hypothetical protein